MTDTDITDDSDTADRVDAATAQQAAQPTAADAASSPTEQAPEPLPTLDEAEARSTEKLPTLDEAETQAQSSNTAFNPFQSNKLFTPSELSDVQREWIQKQPGIGTILKDFMLNWNQASADITDEDTKKFLESNENYHLTHNAFMDGTVIPTVTGLASLVAHAANTAMALPVEAADRTFNQISGGDASPVSYSMEVLGGDFGLFHMPLHELPETLDRATANGITLSEGVADGTERPTPQQEQVMQAAAARLPAEPEPAPPAPDIHTLARQIDPETFDAYDRAVHEREIASGMLNTIREGRRADPDALLSEAPHTQEISELTDKLENASARNAKRYQQQIADLTAKNQQWVDEQLRTETPEEATLRQAVQDADVRARDAAFDKDTGVNKVKAAYDEAAKRVGQVAEPAGSSLNEVNDVEGNEGTQPATPKAVSTEPADTTGMERVGQPKPIEDQKAAIASDVAQKLVAAGRTPEQAEHEAAIISHRYATRAALYNGRKGTAEEMYGRDAPLIESVIQKHALQAEPMELAQKDKRVFDLSENKTNEPFRTNKLGNTTISYDVGADGSIHIHNIGTPEDLRGQGSARAALSKLISEADEEGQTITLDPAPLDQKTDPERLKNFYKSLGFEDDGSGQMVRETSTSLMQKARGKIQLATNSARAIIKLFQSQNASTFLHEMGHHWLDEMMRDAAEGDAPESIKIDAAKVRAWLGDETGPYSGFTRRQHEKFARGFERYLMEGVAPSPALARTFGKFRQWLTDIYGTVSKLRAPINEDIRGVFDRMLSENPERQPVIAPDREPGKAMADIHEHDAVSTPTEKATAVADNIRKERRALATQQAPEAINDITRGAGAQTTGGEAGITEPNGNGAASGSAGGPQESPAPSSPISQGGNISTPESPKSRPVNPYTKVPKKPQSLVDFIRKNGGLKDEGGDIAHTLGGSKYRPGLINNKRGMTLDHAAHLAWEKGYFPEAGDTRPEINDLLDKISEDLNGNHQFSSHDQNAVDAYHDAQSHNEQVDRITHELGIDTNGKTKEQIWDEVAEKTSVEKQAQLYAELSKPLEDEFNDFENKQKQWLDSRGDAWEPEQDPATRTLEDLENERQQEELARNASQSNAGSSESGSAAGGAGFGQEGGRQGGGSVEPSGRDQSQGTDTANRSAPESGTGSGSAARDNQRPVSDKYVDKAGNIRTELFTTREDVARFMVDQAQENFDVFNHAKFTDRQRFDLANKMGISEKELSVEKLQNLYRQDGIPLAVRVEIGDRMLTDAANKATDAKAALLAERTPENIAAFAEARRRFLMIGEAVSGARNEWGLAGRAMRGIPKEAREHSAAMSDLFQKTTGLTDDELYQMALKMDGLKAENGQVAKFIQNSTKPKFGQKMVEYRTNALISGPITHARYAVGNAVNALYDPLVHTPIAATIGLARELVTGSAEDRVYFGEIAAQLHGIGKGSVDGLRAAVQAWKDERSPPLPGEKLPTDQPVVNQHAIGGPLGTAIRIPGRSVGSIHSFFKQLRYEQNIQALAYRTARAEGLMDDAFDGRVAELTQSPTEDMMDKATSQALKQVYMEPTKYGTGMYYIQKGINSIPFAKCMVPFMKIGTQIESQALLEGTPVGWMNKDIREGLMYKKGGAEGDMAHAKVAAGIGLMGATALMAAQGHITGDGPTDARQRAVWLLNHKPNHITIGGLSFSYKGAGPIGMQMRFAANMYETSLGWQDETGTKLAENFLETFTKSVLDDNWMYGVKQFLDAVYNPDENGAQFVRNFATSWLPYSVGMHQVAGLVDPYMRSSQTIFDAARANVPVESESLFPKRDVFGNPIPSNGSIDAYKNDPVVQRMEALQIGVGRLANKIRGVPLNGAQYDDYSRIAGRLSKQRLDGVVGNPSFAQVPADTQIKIIRKIIESSRESARAAVMMQYPDILQKANAAKTKH